MISRRLMLTGTAGLIALATARLVRAEALTLIAARRGTMEIKRNGSQPSRKGQAEYFTGTVRIDPLFQAPDPARIGAGQVTFEPGARTAWHSHPLARL
jgi:hypothetical protein